MRIGLTCSSDPSAIYRALLPGRAMAKRGHEVLWPQSDGLDTLKLFADCDVVHVWGSVTEPRRKALANLAKSGVPFTYDCDDNVAALPKESPVFQAWGGFSGQRRHAMSVRLAQMARVFTTTNETLAEKYRNSGVEPVEVIGNYLDPDVERPRVKHDGIVIGWFAAREHRADVSRVDVVDALQRILETHKNVRVECIGIDLALEGRYRFDGWVPFRELPVRVGGFDIGIAPLADIALNRARSDIKVKEYAASGVPWLASPVGPYVGLGEENGGRLVPEGGWFESLDQLVRSKRDRRRLGRHGKAWAETQTIDAVAEQWEQVFAQAAL